MSDGMTDVARDEERKENYVEYIVALAAYLTDPSKEKHEKVMETAKATDEVRGGYFTTPTKIIPNLARHLHDLTHALEEQRTNEGKLSFEMRTGRKR